MKTKFQFIGLRFIIKMLSLSLFTLMLFFTNNSCQRDEETGLQDANFLLKSGNSNNSILYWGHEIFTRGTGKPVVVSKQITTPYFNHFTNEFTLKVRNGNGTSNKVSSAVIMLDNVQIFGPSDFSQNADSLSKPIPNLTANSVIQVEVRGVPGGFLDIWIEGVLTDIEVNIDNTLTVNFPAGSIMSADPTVDLITDSNLINTFELTSDLFGATNLFSFQVNISIGNEAPINDSIEALIDIPDNYISMLPTGYGMNVFALVYQNGGEELIEIFELLPSSFNATTKTLSSKLPRWIFTNARNGLFETILTVASTPGENSLKSSTSGNYILGECEASPIMCPLPTCIITSPYDLYRVHPITNVITPHWGTDFRASIGTPVYAVEDGTVKLVKTQVDADGNETGYGLYVIVELDNNKGSVLYAHLSEVLVSKNETVNKNDVIAESGNSGASTGPHLHFEYVPSGWIIQSKGRINPVPCITENSSNNETDYFIDPRDNHVYQTVKIGDQWWMAENLQATKYRDGTSIPNVTSNSSWSNLTTGAYCWYNNDASNKSTYGALYNSKAIFNSHGLSPEGWHIPSMEEWYELRDYLDGDDEAGGKMKETGYDHWAYPNVGATNESGFTALPGGRRDENGSYHGIGLEAQYFSSFSWPSAVEMGYNGASISSYSFWLGTENLGLSVRCVKD